MQICKVCERSDVEWYASNKSTCKECIKDRARQNHSSLLLGCQENKTLICKVCEQSDVEWYASNRVTCKECMKDRARQNYLCRTQRHRGHYEFA